MKLPGAPTGITSPTAIVEWLRSFVASVAVGWNVEHDSDGQHAWGWTDIPYDAGRFTASSSTWGVDSADLVAYFYGTLGTAMVLGFRILGTDVGAGNSELRLALPNGYRIARYAHAVLSYSDAGGANDIGLIEAKPGDRFLRLYTRTVANWTNTAGDNTNVQGTITMVVAKD